jgi:hypothetical protein
LQASHGKAHHVSLLLDNCAWKRESRGRSQNWCEWWEAWLEISCFLDKGQISAFQLNVFNDTEVRIVVFLYPSTLIELWQNNEQFIVMVLFNNGSGDMGAYAASAFVADSKDVDGFHGLKLIKNVFKLGNFVNEVTDAWHVIKHVPLFRSGLSTHLVKFRHH